MLEATYPTDKSTPSDWEETMYPTASRDLHLWMRKQRGMIRAFLASPHGRTEAIRNDRKRSLCRTKN